MLWSLALLPMASGCAVFVWPSRTRFALGVIAGSALALTFILAIMAAASGWTAGLDWNDSMRLTAGLTPLSATVAILVPSIATPVMIYAAAHEGRDGLPRLIAIMLVFAGGMELLVIADDLLTLLIGWELVGACSWALISHHWRDPANPPSGLYAFVMTRFGDLGLFAAAMAAFAGSGSFSYAGLAGLQEPYLTIVAFGVLLSAAAKSGQLPFSPWLFRAMAGPTSVSALLHAATMVAAGAYLLIRLQPLIGGAPGFSPTVLIVGLLTALCGGIVALLQNHAKKLLAASTSAHFGLMFVAVGAGFPGVALFHLVAHAAFKGLLFLAAGIAGDRAQTFALHRMGFGKALPVIAGMSAVGALALAGVPPLGGAWTKEAIASAAGETGFWPIAGVMVAGALSAAYATRFQLLSYGSYGSGRKSPGDEFPSVAEYAGLGALALMTLAISVLWLPFVNEALAGLIGTRLPGSSLVEMTFSLALVVAGVLGGWVLARRYRTLGTQGTPRAAAEWLGLPILITGIIVKPFDRLAMAAAWIDNRLVDGGIRLTAAFATWLSRVGDRLGERLTDGIPEGSAWLVGFSGRDVRRLQTGLSHHYYMLLAIGAAVTMIILILGS